MLFAIPAFVFSFKLKLLFEISERDINNKGN